MTPEQRKLARHALGLPNNRRKSYRNAFVTGKSTSDHPHWMAMVASGDATRRDGKTIPYGGDDIFYLTRAGAEKALEPRESLDPEDFPS